MQTESTVRSSRDPRAVAARFKQTLSLKRSSALYLGLGFVIVFGYLQPSTFLTETTFRLVATEGVIIAVLALAFLVPLAANQFDLAIGATMSLSLVTVNWIAANTDLPAVVGVIAALGACGLVGIVSGFLVVRWRVNSFIATLGVGQIITALVLLISDNRQITGAFSASYLELGRGSFAGVPYIVIYLLVLAGILWFVLEHTPVGRSIFATGGNPEAARLAGVRTDGFIVGSLITSSVIAGLAGVLFSMKVGTFSTSVGPGLLFPAVAAVFLGASQFSQRPNVWGTLVAYFALALGIKGLQLQAGPGGFWIRPLFEGVALVAAVAIASRQASVRLGWRSRRKAESGESHEGPAEALAPDEGVVASRT